jgi:hypothetical protein
MKSNCLWFSFFVCLALCSGVISAACADPGVDLVACDSIGDQRCLSASEPQVCRYSVDADANCWDPANCDIGVDSWVGCTTYNSTCADCDRDGDGFVGCGNDCSDVFNAAQNPTTLNCSDPTNSSLSYCINPNITENTLARCTDSVDNNCNNFTGAYDTNAATGVDCGDPMCNSTSFTCSTCTGASTFAYNSSADTCRASAGDCDTADTCTGSNSTCPADAKSSAECRASAGTCDVAETCDGILDDCPVDAFLTSVCRAATNDCDVAETCSGSSATCGSNLFQALGIVCSGGTCAGTSATCVAASNSGGGPPPGYAVVDYKLVKILEEPTVAKPYNAAEEYWEEVKKSSYWIYNVLGSNQKVKVIWTGEESKYVVVSGTGASKTSETYSFNTPLEQVVPNIPENVAEAFGSMDSEKYYGEDSEFLDELGFDFIANEGGIVYWTCEQWSNCSDQPGYADPKALPEENYPSFLVSPLFWISRQIEEIFPKSREELKLEYPGRRTRRCIDAVCDINGDEGCIKEDLLVYTPYMWNTDQFPATNQSCNIDCSMSDEEFCENFDYDCGRWEFCGREINCGGCLWGDVCSAGQCVCEEEWSCDGGGCASGNSFVENCVDLNKCGTERKKPSEQSCDSCFAQWGCEEVQACAARYDILGEELPSLKINNCVDANGCFGNLLEEEVCSLSSSSGVDPQISVTGTSKGGANVILTNPSTKGVLSKVSVSKNSEGSLEAVDIEFVNGEEDVDATIQETYSDQTVDRNFFDLRKWISTVLWAVLTVMFMLLVFRKRGVFKRLFNPGKADELEKRIEDWLSR